MNVAREDVYGIVGFALLATIMFCQIGPVIEHQDRCITEYCVMHPTETITGDMTINCSEWLAVKFTGLFLIKLSGQDCELMMADMAGMMDGMYSLSALLGVGALYKVVRVIKGV